VFSVYGLLKSRKFVTRRFVAPKNPQSISRREPSPCLNFAVPKPNRKWQCLPKIGPKFAAPAAKIGPKIRCFPLTAHSRPRKIVPPIEAFQRPWESELPRRRPSWPHSFSLQNLSVKYLFLVWETTPPGCRFCQWFIFVAGDGLASILAAQTLWPGMFPSLAAKLGTCEFLRCSGFRSGARLPLAPSGNFRRICWFPVVASSGTPFLAPPAGFLDPNSLKLRRKQPGWAGFSSISWGATWWTGLERFRPPLGV